MFSKNVTALQDQILMHRKVASEHNFYGVNCSLRAFQGIFKGAKKIQSFSESSRAC